MTEDGKGEQSRIVVGIDGSEAGQHALEWAAAEAERRGAHLVIAHAGDLPNRKSLSEDTARAALREIESYGRQLLDDAVEVVAEDFEAVDVRTELVEANPGHLLVDLSNDASLVVVGRGNAPTLARFVLGSVSQHVAAHAACPVIVVDGSAPTAETIVVGGSPTAGGRRALRFACSEAERRGAPVVVVRSWSELSFVGTGPSYGNSVPFSAVEEAEQDVLDDVVRAAREEFPTVEITGELTSTSAYHALTQAGEKAALLVVGCRRDEHSHLPHLGPLTSWLMHHSPCPLAIVPAL
ncbi:MAG TPA: universal stress protein [Jatrophihabitantaceae bacterium]|jgi:nucleotide-binding universal stress UspA family protein|nr:universal stress protein [Jatrophihabitantaceae bacterium]